MMQRTTYLAFVGGAAMALALAVSPERPRAATATTEGCAVTADQALTYQGDALAAIAPTLTGASFDVNAHTMGLMRSGGSFIPLTLPITDDLTMGCAGDFNRDGFDDIIGSDASGVTKMYLNLSKDLTAPDWELANATRAVGFAPGVIVDAATTAKGVGWMACGDVDNDGYVDAVLMRCSAAGDTDCNGPDRHVIYYGNGLGGVRETRTLLKVAGRAGRLYYKGTHVALYDITRDGYKDLIIGNSSAGGGKVVYIAATTNLDKRFDSSATLIDNVGYANAGGVTSLAIGDFTNDGRVDIAVGNLYESVVKLYPGTGGTSFGTATSIATTANPVALLAGNFTLAGRADLVVVKSGSTATLYQNDGDTTPFSAGPTTTLVSAGAGKTFDLGFAMNYDGDPQSALDLVAFDTEDDATHDLLANRMYAGPYVDCGAVSSDNITSPELAGREAVITAMRMTPIPSTPTAGSWTFQASNDGQTWHDATACEDNPADFCVTFNSTSGDHIQWRVNMCSSQDHTQAPTLSGVRTLVTYVAATNHFRAGPIVRNGLIYVGAFRAPGGGGRFMAIRDETGQVLWDGAAKLDATADSARKIYARDSSNAMRELTAANAAYFVTPLSAADVTQATATITWLRSARFGTAVNHLLGGIVNSTAALLSAPGLPYWYNLAATSTTDKTAILAHKTAYANRQQLALVGAQDGMLHAFYTNPYDDTDVNNGKEAWAFVPPSVMPRLLADKTSSSVSAWPDGSPTLATAKINGSYRSVLVMGEGTGGNAMFALDVTETVSSTGTVTGPTFLWSFTDSNMGLALSKPAVIRAKIGTTETWLAVFASGKGATGDVGDSVYAVDIGTGALVWRFDINDLNTYVSSDIIAVDEESGTADGYISRLFFADSKGRVWKLDPTDVSGGRVHGLGEIIPGTPVTEKALFSTLLTTGDGALGQDRGIAGNIIAAPDVAGRLVLYFGTGGTEETPVDATNAYYAIYADTGEIRSTLASAAGIKFFGSAAYNAGQIIFTRGSAVTSTDPCAATTGEIVAIDSTTFSLQFVIDTGSVIVAPMFAALGEVFVLTLSGKVVATQYTGLKEAVSGGATSGNSGNNSTASVDELGILEKPFGILSWRQVY